jgi:hypothetical protein
MEKSQQDPFEQAMEIMDDIKEKLSDNEYLQIVNTLQTSRRDKEARMQLYACVVLHPKQSLKTSGELIVRVEPSSVLLQLTQARYNILKTAISRFGFAEVSRPPDVLYSDLEKPSPVTIQLSQDMVVIRIRPAGPDNESPIVTV